MMNLVKLSNFQIDDYIKRALNEDITYEDFSTNCIFRDDKIATVSLIAKEDGIICGLDVFKRTFQIFDDKVEFIEYSTEGSIVKKGSIVMDIKANIKTLLSCERVALNSLQRMSGIANETRDLVLALDDKKIKIVDTRKTTPTLRLFEKYAVKVGGGENHRYNLSDMIMLKDNHIAFAGSIKKAVELAKNYAPFVKKIEVECETLEMVKESLDSFVDIIMLDNMDIDMTKKAIELIKDKALIECSGDITKENINRYKGLNISYISSGSITHSFKSFDFSMKNLRY